MAIHIMCNYHPRLIVDARDLPESAREKFDYLDWSNPYDIPNDFVQYKGYWYDLSDVPLAPDSIRAKGFDGFISDSPWSGIAFRYFDEEGYEYEDSVIVASVHW